MLCIILLLIITNNYYHNSILFYNSCVYTTPLPTPYKNLRICDLQMKEKYKPHWVLATKGDGNQKKENTEQGYDESLKSD